MKTLSNIKIVLFLLLVVLFTASSPVSAQTKYALLISAGITTNDDQEIHSEYWYDLFLMYRALIENGFEHENIYVLYGDGNDFNSIHANYQTATVFPGVAQITDYPVSKANVENIFTWLGNGNVAEAIPRIQPDDFLFYWWMGHGFGCSNYYSRIENTAEQVTANEFRTYFDHLPACTIRGSFVMTCHSGALVDDLEGLHTNIHTAAKCWEGAESDLYDVFHAELSYHLASALRQQEADGTPVNSDTNSDGVVSMDEINDYVHLNTLLSESQIGDYRNIAPLINVADAQPASLVPRQGVYSRDYAQDDGREPSDYMAYIWYEGPDLWVRNFDDNETEHENPQFAQTNFVYARLHNIGCDTTNANVDLSWAEVSAWSNPASWHPIATVAANNLESSESRVVSAPWTTVPAPGKYCMHTVLDAPGDPPNADGRAFMDNNKVQINVDVEYTVPTWIKNFYWLIENGINKPVPVDVVLEKINVPASVQLSVTVPRGLEFGRVIGGHVETSAAGRTIIISRKADRAVLQGVQLAPMEKVEAVLSVVTPEKLKHGDSLNIEVSEQIKGRKMGGIVFKTRIAKPEQVLAILFSRVAGLFKMLDKKFNMATAMDPFELAQAAASDCRRVETRKLKPLFSRLVKQERKIKSELAKVMQGEDLKRFSKALQMAQTALKKWDLGALVASHEEMIMSTKPLFMVRKPQRPIRKISH